MRTASNEKSEKITLSLLFMLTRRMILFLSLLLCVLILFYIVGNYQFFLDSSQKIVLRSAAVTASALFIISVSGIIETILCIVFLKNKRMYFIIHLVLIFIAQLLSIASLILFRIIDIVSTGL